VGKGAALASCLRASPLGIPCADCALRGQRNESEDPAWQLLCRIFPFGGCLRSVEQSFILLLLQNASEWRYAVGRRRDFVFEIDKQQFGAFVAEQRRAQRMTQKELAAKMFVTDKAISKWENGGGLPDITLLTPLAETLEVTVAELLAGEKLPESITQERTDELVQTAISMNAFREKPRRKQIAGLALRMFLVAAECILLWLVGFRTVVLDENVLTMMGICGGFVVYFWFLAPQKLPDYFDQNRIGAFSDGPLRMNVPGMRFTNRNWPHIVKALRNSLFAVMFICPLTVLVGVLLGAGEVGQFVSKLFLLAAVLCGVLLPLYVAGRKYE